MRDTFDMALAQFNPAVGDLAGNAALVLQARAQAAAAGADLLLCPALALTGAPLLDLAREPAFLAMVERAVAMLAAATAEPGPALLLGAPWPEGGALRDAVLLLDGGRLAGIAARCTAVAGPDLDGRGLFAPAPPAGPLAVRGLPLGILVGEDLDGPEAAESLQESGAAILLAVAASPFLEGMFDLRLSLAAARVTETGLPLVWLNLLGGQDEHVFDGGAFVLNGDRRLALQAPHFRPALPLARFRAGAGGWHCLPGTIEPPPEGVAALDRALCLAIGDAVRKGGFAGPDLPAETGTPEHELAVRLLADLAREALAGDAPPAGAAAPKLRLIAESRADFAAGRVPSGPGLAPFRDLLPAQLQALARHRGLLPPEVAAGAAAAEPDLSDLLAAEAARRTAPPGIRLTRTMLGRDRRYPLAAALRSVP